MDLPVSSVPAALRATAVACEVAPTSTEPLARETATLDTVTSGGGGGGAWWCRHCLPLRIRPG